MAQTVKIGRVKGSMWYTGTSFPQEGILDGDMFLDTENKKIYQYKNNQWELVSDINLTQQYIDEKIAELVNSAPSTLDTLGELAEAINNHEDSYDALLEVVGNKADKSYVDDELNKKADAHWVSSMELSFDSSIDRIDEELKTKANINDVPTKVSQLENDANYTTGEFVEEAVDSLKKSNRILFELEKNELSIYGMTTQSLFRKIYDLGYMKSVGSWYQFTIKDHNGKLYQVDLQTPDGGASAYINILYRNYLYNDLTSEEIKFIDIINDTNNKITTQKYVDQAVANAGGSSTTETRTYDIVLTEKSWVRLAKVKDVTKNSSGRFKVMCYAVKDDVKTELTASIFNVGCGIVNDKVEVDVLPISQTPNLSSASGGGSGDSGSDGSGGSGGFGSYGLNNITVEEFKGELYVCGFINFPNIELYDACRLEISIDHNLNYEYMDSLEVVDFTAVEYETQGASLIEGVNLVANEGYNFTIRTRLDTFNDCYVNGYSGYVSMSSDSDIHYSMPLLDIYEETITLYDGSPDNTFIKEFPLRHLFNVDILTDELIIDGTNLDYETLSETIYRKICTLQGYHNRVDFGLVITGRIKYTSNSGDFQILLNGEPVLSTGQSNYFDFTELDMRKDVLEVVGDGDEFNLELSVTLSNSYFDITLKSIIPEKSFTIGYLDNDSPYNFSLFYDELNIHSKTDSYELVSMYNRIEELENNIIDIRQTYNTLDGRVIVHAYDSLNLDSSLEDLKWFLLDNGIPYSSMYLSSWEFTLDNFSFVPITDNYFHVSSIIDNTKYLNATLQMDMSTTTIRDIINMHQPFVTEDKTLTVAKEKIIEDNFTTLIGKKIGFKKINSIEEFNNFSTININFYDNNGNYFDVIRCESATWANNPYHFERYIQGRYKDGVTWTNIYKVETNTGIYSDIKYSGKSFETGSFDDYYLTFEEDNQELINKLNPVIEKYELANDIQKTDILKFNGNKIATEEFVEEKLGDINTILDKLNGEVV